MTTPACTKQCTLVMHMTGGKHRTDCAAYEETRRTKICVRCAALVPRDLWEVDPPDGIGGGPCEACGRDDAALVQEVWMTPGRARTLGAAAKTAPSCGGSIELNHACPTCRATPGLCCIKIRDDLTFPSGTLGTTGNEFESLGFTEWHETRVAIAVAARGDFARHGGPKP